ncbi:class I SAM-dependent methyltransferase [Polaribacter marinivivus]|uniref:class I SAM-dependent methyltransferase n=1 Tax=Polaribacter marinivivus TaxID=1524260 RepID=UPI003D3519DF
MNLAILKPEVQEFISKNLKIEITKIILKGSPFEDIESKELANQILAKKKSEKKLPTWFSSKNIYYPNKISIEQTSSEITAAFKSKLVTGNSIIDITGGFGVDSFYFSKQFKKVIHCEINSELSTIVKHNYQQLNAKNIETYAINGFDFLKETNDTFDCIYVDPSRRNDVKGKVFLLKDCLPYIPPKIDFFFTKANQILIKVSPILDITNTINELKNVKSVHIVAVHNEVKELLFLLEKNYAESTNIIAVNIGKSKTDEFSFEYQSKETSNFSEPLSYLYEPNSAILKSGGFHQISKKYNVHKLEEHSHLYTSENFIDFPGRAFKIVDILSYDKKKLKKRFSKSKANITTRNFPKTVAQIRKEINIKDGGTDYLFFTTTANKNLKVIICQKC